MRVLQVMAGGAHGGATYSQEVDMLDLVHQAADSCPKARLSSGEAPFFVIPVSRGRRGLA